MSTSHREMIDALLKLYVHRLPDDVADEEAAKFAGVALDDVHVLWAGGLDPGVPHYYRLHGPTILVETTTPPAARTTSTWCGETLAATSPTTLSPATTPPTIRDSAEGFGVTCRRRNPRLRAWVRGG
jgi:hypothetical protein